MKPKAVLFDLDGTLLPMDQDAFTKGYFKLLAKKLSPHGYEPEPIERFITETIHRGATRLQGEGVYTHEGKMVLLTVVSRHEAVLLRNFIRQQDPGAFMIITSSTEIIGKGFRGIN